MNTRWHTLLIGLSLVSGLEARAADPAYLDLIREKVTLRQEDETLLAKNGLVVLGDGMPNPAHAYAFAFTQELPQMVTMESLFWAVAIGHQAMVEKLELGSIAPEARAVLETMHERWRHAKEAWPAEIQADVDLYLTIARSLDAGEIVEPLFATNVAGVAEWLERIARPELGLDTVELFGRVRQIDLSAFKPRGAYSADGSAIGFGPTDPAELEKERWFRAATWLTRVELNLVSRDCRSSHPELSFDPSETPREANVALALSRLAHEAGVGTRLTTLSRALD